MGNGNEVVFVAILNILQSNQADLFGFWGVRVHSANPPDYGPIIST